MVPPPGNGRTSQSSRRENGRGPGVWAGGGGAVRAGWSDVGAPGCARPIRTYLRCEMSTGVDDLSPLHGSFTSQRFLAHVCGCSRVHGGYPPGAGSRHDSSTTRHHTPGISRQRTRARYALWPTLLASMFSSTRDRPTLKPDATTKTTTLRSEML